MDFVYDDDDDDDDVATPLVRAVINKNQEEVREALRQGHSASLQDDRGWTPVHEAAIDDTREDCLKELLAHSTAIINAQTFVGETALYLACLNDCVKGVILLLAQPACNVNLCNSDEVSPLHVACIKGNKIIVRYLVEYGAKVNIQDFDGHTPLHETVGSINAQESRDELLVDICEYLIDRGADPELVESNGNKAFHLACKKGLLKCAKQLFSISKQNDLVNSKNNDGRTPLMLAVRSNKLHVVEYLLSSGANADIVDSMGVTALHLAAYTNNFDMFSAVLRVTSKDCIFKYCTFDEERDFERLVQCRIINSIICLVIESGDLSFLTKVLESDLDKAVLSCPVIRTHNSSNEIFTLHTPVSFLLENKMRDLGNVTFDFLNALISHGISWNVKSKHVSITYVNPICAGIIALHHCTPELVLKCLKVLLDLGADPDEPHGSMPVAMEEAIICNNAEAVLLLLQYSNVLEPETIIQWIEENMLANQEKLLELLMPLAPYYSTPETESLPPDQIGNPRRKALLSRDVQPLGFYCRTLIRKHLHEETKSCTSLFQQKLSDLLIPAELSLFLRFK